MKTLAKQILFGLLALALTLSLVACGGDGDVTATTTGGDDVVTTTSADGDQTDATTTTADGGAQATGSNNASRSTTTSTTKNQQSSDAKSLSWAEVKAKMPANLKGSTITLYNWNTLDSITDGAKIAENFKKETGITLNWVKGSYNNYATEIAAKQAAKDAPDIIRMKETNPTLMAMLQPLSNTGYDFTDAAWDQGVMDAYSYKGVAYATNLKDTLLQQPDVLMYNSALIAKYDLDDPYKLWKQGKWTWEKFADLCRDFLEEAGDNMSAVSPNLWTTAAQSRGADFVKYDSEKGFTSGMSDKNLVVGLQEFIKMKSDGILMDGLYKDAAFTAGTVLFHHDSIIGARKTHFNFADMKANGTLGVVPLPKVDGQSTYYQLYREMEAYGIPDGAKNAAAVPYFLRYFLSEDNYDANTFFTNKTVLEVYNHCMSQKNRVQTYVSSVVLTTDSGINYNNLARTAIDSTAAQVATLLGQQKAKVEASVRQANAILAKAQ